MFVEPHTPQADVIVKRRSRMRTDSSELSETSAITTFARCLKDKDLSAQTLTEINSSGDFKKPSPHKKPAANSKSEPGVRMVMPN